MQIKPLSFALPLTAGLALSVSVTLACPSGMVCPPGQSCTQPSDCVTPSPAESGGGSATTPSTAGETSSTPTTTKEQLGTTLDLPDDPDFIDWNGGRDKTLVEHLLQHDFILSYLRYVNWVTDMERRALMRAQSENTRQQARERAKKDAGADAAWDTYMDASRADGDAAFEVREHEEILKHVEISVGAQAVRVEQFGRGHPDRHGLTAGEILDNLQKGLDYSRNKHVELQNRAANTLEAKNNAWNDLMETQDRANQLEGQYYDQMMGGK